MRLPLGKHHPESGAKEYQKTRILTSGKLQSHIMLCEKAMNLIHDLQNFDAAAQMQAQNIVSQLQRGLNIRTQAAQELYKVLGVVWDVIELGNVNELSRAASLLEQYHETLRSIAGLNKAVGE